MTKVRQSNMELLRIIAMFMVMMFHCNFHTMGHPSFEMIAQQPLDSFMAFVIQAVSVMCVNVFVLLSGWFGIHPTLYKANMFIFQILFFTIGSYVLQILIGNASLNIKDIVHCLFLDKSGWFIKAYLCLYIFAPILNAYSELADRKPFKYLLISFFVFQSIFGWVTDAAEFIHYGFSTISFVGLYLLARYIRRFRPSWTNYKRGWDLGTYFLLVLGSATACLVVGHFPQLGSLFHSFVGHVYAYTSPFVILMCIFILLYFSKLTFCSRSINFVAASAFAVILVHGNPHIFSYTDRVIDAYANYGYWGGLCYVAIMNCVIFTLAIILDQLRLICWKAINMYSTRI